MREIAKLLWRCPVFLLYLAACGEFEDSRPPTQGWEVGSGGNHCVLDWFRVADEVKDILSASSLPKLSREKFVQIIRDADVIPRERVYLDAEKTHEADAINYRSAPRPRIEVNCARWERASFSDKLRIEIHEYSNLLGEDDSKGQISSHLDVLKVCSRTKQIREWLEETFQKPCRLITGRDIASVVAVDLSQGQIKQLSRGDFNSFLNLKQLTLSGNGLIEIPSGLFQGLSRLESLNLSHNRIARLSEGAFDGLSGLRSLDLTDNSISSFERNSFSGLTVLSQLGGAVIGDDKVSRWWNNPITELKANFLGDSDFSGTVNLCPEPWVGTISISLQPKRSRGYITRIEPDAFAGLATLKLLQLCFDLTDSPEEFPPMALKELGNAQTLWLSGFGYSRLPEGFFRALTYTESLIVETISELSANQFTEMNDNPNRLHRVTIPPQLRFPARLAIERHVYEHFFLSSAVTRLTHFSCRRQARPASPWSLFFEEFVFPYARESVEGLDCVRR